MACDAKEFRERNRYWGQLEQQEPRAAELWRLLQHLKWMRLSDEAKRQFLPGIGPRRRWNDRPDDGM